MVQTPIRGKTSAGTNAVNPTILQGKIPPHPQMHTEIEEVDRKEKQNEAISVSEGVQYRSDQVQFS